MSNPSLFKWRHFAAEVILCSVRWYLRYTLSYRDVEELMQERGLAVDHTTIFRWVQRYAPELDKRCRPLLNATNDSYRVDETYIKINKQWYYLYRAVDATGATIDFMLSATRYAQAAERFFRKALRAPTPYHPASSQSTRTRRIPQHSRPSNRKARSLGLVYCGSVSI
jgi:transposase, IS6 family